MLGLHKIIRASHIVSCPIVSIFFKRLPGGSIQSYGTRFFIVFLAVWILFPKFSGGLRSALYYNCMKL